MEDKQTAILKGYQKKADEIIMKMFNVLSRAQRKIDDLEYRKILEKLHKL